MEAAAKILIVEDNPFDLELIQRELRKGGIHYHTAAVCTRHDYIPALKEFCPHIILAGFSLPRLSGIDAYDILRETTPGLPFILIAGAGEEAFLIDFIEKGITDYVLKNSLFTLNVKIKRALDEAAKKRQNKQAEQQLGIIYNSVPDAIFMIEPETPERFKFVFANQAFLQVTGLAREAVINNYTGTVIPVAYRQRITERFMEALQLKKPVIWEDSFHAGSKTGTVCITPVLNHLGVCTHLVGTMHEITDQKILIQSLVESNQRNDYVTRATFDAIWDWDIASRKVYWGEGYIKLFGKVGDDNDGDIFTLHKRIHPDDIHLLLAHANAFIRGKETNWQYEHRYLKSDGSYAYVSNKAIVIRNHEGRAIRVIGAMQDITRRKQLETTLNTAINIARFGTWELDVLNDTLYLSDMIYEIIESKADHTPTLESGLLFYKEGKSRDLIIQKVNEAIDKGLPFDIEAEIVTLAGVEKWIRVLGAPQSEKGKCIKITGSVQDIDTRKRAELAVIKILKERNNILESIADAFFAVDKNWVFTYWNNHAEKIFNVKREVLLGNKIWNVFPGRIGSKTYAEYNKSMEEGSVSRFEDYNPQLEKWFAVHCYPAENGGLAVYVKDITARKAAELQMNELNVHLQQQASELALFNMELEASEQRFSSIFNLSPQPMWLFDEDSFEFVQVNEAAIKLYGYSKEEFMQMGLPEIKLPRDLAQLKDEIARAKMKGTVYNRIYRHRKKSGEIIEVEVFSTEIIINGRKLLSSIVIDVTEKNQQEYKILKAIIKTQEDERYVIGGELHDNVCQILAVSQLTLDMLGDSLDPAKQLFFDQCRSNLKLAFQEIRNLSHRLAPSFFNESTLEEAFKKMLESITIGNDTKVTLHFDPLFNEQTISMDAQLNLYRILQEQLRNVFKYAKASLVEINIFIRKGQLLLTVTDNGIGFDSTKMKSGIGLANIERRTALFSGRFEIRSSPGNGCTIEVAIPLEEIASQPTG